MSLANSLAFSPDGKLLACGCSEAVQIWDVASGRETAQLNSNWFATFSPDGRTLASRGDMGELQLWEMPSQKIRFKDDKTNPHAELAAFSPDGQLLATGNDSPQFTLRDAASGTVLYEEKLPVTVLSRGRSRSSVRSLFTTQGSLLTARKLLLPSRRLGRSVSHRRSTSGKSFAIAPAARAAEKSASSGG